MQQWDAKPAPRAGSGVHIALPLPCIFVLPQLPVGQALRQSGAIAALPNARVSTLRKYYFTALVYRTLCRLQ